MRPVNFRFDHRMGPILGHISEVGLNSLLLPTPRRRRDYALEASRDRALARVLSDAFVRYFAGKPEDFADVPLDFSKATPFQRQVWLTAREIPWGQTCAYGDLAERMGRSRAAARAVGQALGANPVPIVVPCHRILAAGGGLGGFGAGLEWKRELLRVEGAGLVR